MSGDATTESDINSVIENAADSDAASRSAQIDAVLAYVRSHTVKTDMVVDFLTVCFRHAETAIIAETLGHLYPTLDGIDIQFVDSAPSPHLVGIRRAGHVQLLFPRDIAFSPNIRVQVLWLIWFLPQLEHAVKADSQARGFA